MNEVAMTDSIIDAAKSGDLEKIHDLVSQGLKVDVCDEYGQTALHWAAKEGKVELLRTFIKEYNLNVEVQDQDGWHLFLLAAWKGNMVLL